MSFPLQASLEVEALTIMVRFGSSLSYASSDGKSAAASPQMLHNQLIEDDVEVIVMSDKACSDGSCGYTRPDGVAHRKFHSRFFIPC